MEQNQSGNDEEGILLLLHNLMAYLLKNFNLCLII